MKYIVDNFEDVENIMLLYFKDFNNKIGNKINIKNYDFCCKYINMYYLSGWYYINDEKEYNYFTIILYYNNHNIKNILISNNDINKTSKYIDVLQNLIIK